MKRRRRERMRVAMTAAAALLTAAVIGLGSAHAASPLTVQTKSPAAGATISGNVVWEVTVGNGTPSRVDFQIDGVTKWTEHAAPYRYNGDTGFLDATTLSAGQHTLQAIAVDYAGQATTSSVSIAVAPSPIAVVTSTPAAGATVSGNVLWEAKVTAGTASEVDFLIDGTQKWVERVAPYRFNGDNGTLDTTTLSNGSHKLTVRGIDALGRTATSDTTITVSNGT